MIGPTGEQPISSRSNDRGGLNAALSIVYGLVHLDFGTSISWLCMTPLEARIFADELRKKAEKAEHEAK